MQSSWTRFAANNYALLFSEIQTHYTAQKGFLTKQLTFFFMHGNLFFLLLLLSSLLLLLLLLFFFFFATHGG